MQVFVFFFLVLGQDSSAFFGVQSLRRLSTPSRLSLKARLGWNFEGLTSCIDISETRPAEEVSFVFVFDMEVLVLFTEWRILTELYVPSTAGEPSSAP